MKATSMSGQRGRGEEGETQAKNTEQEAPGASFTGNS